MAGYFYQIHNTKKSVNLDSQYMSKKYRLTQSYDQDDTLRTKTVLKIRTPTVMQSRQQRRAAYRGETALIHTN
jgi:hypothetical protein